MRINLPNDNWAVIHDTVMHGMRVAVQLATPPGIGIDNAGRAIMPDGNLVPQSVNVAVDEATVLSGVIQWSFGEVNEETLRSKVPADDFATLLSEVMALYQAHPLATVQNGAGEPRG